MRAQILNRCLGALLLPLVLVLPANAQQPLTSAFTYQGQLELNSGAVDGATDMRFTLWDAETAGNGVGTSVNYDGISNPPVQVTAGNFEVLLDFGVDSFDGNRRWLEVAVRFPAGSGGFTTLSPRQELTAAPYAMQTRGLFVDANNHVGIGTLTPLWPLDIMANQGVVRLTTRTSPNGSVLELKNIGTTPSYLGAINFNDDAQTYPGQISYDVGQSDHLLKFRVQGSTPAWYTRWGLNLAGTGQFRENAALRSVNTNSSAGMAAYFENNSTWATAHFQNSGSGEILWLQHEGTGNYIVATDGTDWKFWVDNVGTTHTKVLQILGGADLSEQFDVSSPDQELLPGMTVCIDPNREGRLLLSRHSYDHRVAGIVSGAGGVKPGMLMAQEGSIADGGHPVALTGRVYCWVDATYGPIAPGDLLTTSDTPGHAMKASDHVRAQGAILGKAMGHLETGRGLVLVLVGLQ